MYDSRRSHYMLTAVTLRRTLNASTPAWTTGAKTVSLSLVSANMSGIWSRRLEWEKRTNSKLVLSRGKLMIQTVGHVLMRWLLLVDDGSGVLVVDEEAVEQRDEHLSCVWHHHHLRLGQSALHVVEVKHLVVGDKAHLDGRALRIFLPGEKKTKTWAAGFRLTEAKDVFMVPTWYSFPTGNFT